MKLSKPKKILLSAAAGLFVMSLATQAYAFCFSSDSLSNTSFSVRQMPYSAYQKITKKYVKSSNCNILPAKTKKKCLDLKKKGDKATSDFYEFMTGLPLVGDPIDKGMKEYMKKMRELRGSNFAKDVRKAVKDANKAIDDVLKPISTRFRADKIRGDETRCCNWKNKDCNPTGKKNGTIHFNMKYAGISRIVRLGATDHMECKINKKEPINSVCRNYVFPNSPSQPNKKTFVYSAMLQGLGGKCLDVDAGNKKNGAKVQLWKCHGGKNQRWSIYKNGIIRSLSHGKCLDVSSGKKNAKNGQKVHLWDCHGGRNQRWSYVKSSDLIISKAKSRSNQCLEIGGAKNKNGAGANIWKCGSVPQHKWKAVAKKKDLKPDYTGKIWFGTRTFQAKHSNKCIDNSNSKRNGGVVHQWTCNAKSPNQQFTLISKFGGLYQLKSKKSGKCLDVKGVSKKNGADVHQWTCGKGWNQLWSIYKYANDGYYIFVARHSQKCLDVRGAGKGNKVRFQQWDCKKVPQQMFRVVK